MTSYLRLTGGSNSYVSAGDLAVLAGATQLDVEIECALDTWASSAGQTLVSHDGNAPNKSWRFLGNVSAAPFDRPYMEASSNGSAFSPAYLVGPTGWTAGSRRWVAVRWLANSGGSSRCTFQQSSDGADWQAIGTQQSGAAITGLFNTTVRLLVGAGDTTAAGSIRATGNVYRVRVFVAGVLVACPDFTRVPVGATSFTDDVGVVWTIGAGASILDDGAHTGDCVFGDGTFGSGVFGCCAEEEVDFNLPIGFGQRQGTFVYRAYKANGEYLGELHPLASEPPTLSHDTSRDIKREISGFKLIPAEAAMVEQASARIKVAYLNNNNQEHKLGTFMYADSVGYRHSYGLDRDDLLVDLGNILAQGIEESFSVNPKQRIDTAILSLLDPVAIWSDIAGTLALSGSPLTWPAGTARTQILDDLALAGGYLSPWFNRDDVLRMITAFNPAERVATFDYDEPGRIIGPVVEASDLLTAPNRFIVIDNSTTSSPIVGRFDVPASAPHSITNRGFVVVEIIQIQGMNTDDQANDVAGAILTARMIHETIQFSSVFDPRHDSWDVLKYRSHNWLELSWAVPLIEGAPMSHVARRAYI